MRLAELFVLRSSRPVYAALDPDTHLFATAIQTVSGIWWSMKTRENGEILIQAFVLAGSNRFSPLCVRTTEGYLCILLHTHMI